MCPPVPSRADYLHHLADLLAADAGEIPRGRAIAGLDVGTGANLIYPLLGAQVYGWRFVATDIDAVSIRWARRLAAQNPSLAAPIDCRQQSAPEAIFSGVIAPEERFAFSVCNPPFHASAEEAAAGTARKLKNLGAEKSAAPRLNFGGRSHELWCRGGEAGFIQRLILESARLPELCVWFTTLVSKRGSLPGLYRSLEKARVADVRTIPLFAGQKQSRVVAWTFLPASERRSRLAVGAGGR